MKRVIATMLILVSLLSGNSKPMSQLEINIQVYDELTRLTKDITSIQKVFRLNNKLHDAYEGQFRKMTSNGKIVKSYVNYLNKKIKKLQMKMVILETAEKFMREKLEKRIEVLEGKK